MFSTTAYSLMAAVQTATDMGPDPKDVKAGWTAFVIFLLMFAAVVALGFFMARQLKTTARNRDAGILPTVEETRTKQGNRNSTDV